MHHNDLPSASLTPMPWRVYTWLGEMRWAVRHFATRYEAEAHARAIKLGQRISIGLSGPGLSLTMLASGGGRMAANGRVSESFDRRS